MTLRPLEGFTIGITADRRWQEQAQLLERRGAKTVHGPSIATMHLTADEDLRAVTLNLIARPPDFLIVTTGIGMRAWFESAHALGLGDSLTRALTSSKVLARGPKAAASCKALSLGVWATAGSERSDELVERLLDEPLAGARVAIQRSGEDGPAPTVPLTEAGADVLEVTIYRWRLPSRRSPASRLIDMTRRRHLHAVTFTSAPALLNFFEIAAESEAVDDIRDAFNSDVTAACIGPVCAERAVELGIVEPLQPDLGRLGLLVHALSDHMAGHRRQFRANGYDVTLQGSAVAVGDATAALTERERALLDSLLERPAVTRSGEGLAKQYWSTAASAHVVSVAMGRLRRKLGPAGPALRVRRGRGYYLDVDP